MAFTVVAGQTFRVSISNIRSQSGQTVNLPVVSIKVRKPDGTEVTGSVSQSGESYYSDMSLSTPGEHTLLLQATGGGAIWKKTESITVEAF